MLAHVRDIHTETALSLVHEQSSCLEYGLDLLVLVIEVMEGDEIPQKSVEITIHMQELVNHVYVG